MVLRKPCMQTLQNEFQALIIGPTGGIGAALVQTLKADPSCVGVIGLGRSTTPSLDLLDEASIATCADHLKTNGAPFDLIFDATGGLTLNGIGPEKSLRAIDPAVMAHQYAVNAIGPALLLKHFSPLLRGDGKSVFATLSARVGSIGDNSLGGWIAYRAAKAALNQIVKTSAIEIARKRPGAVVVALHPGTVRTALTEAIAKTFTHEPDEAARDLLTVLDTLTPEQSGGFFAYDGSEIPW